MATKKTSKTSKTSSKKSTSRKTARPAAPVAMSTQAALAVFRAVKPAAVKLKLAAKAATCRLHKKPKRVKKPERIHPRRFPHRVIEGEESAEFSASTPLAMEEPARARAAAAPQATTDTLVLVRNTELAEAAANNTSSNVGEPSVAMSGNVVLYTGNWYAAISNDGGVSFRFMDPTEFDTVQFRFCCDQVAHYIPSIDTFVWLLQYGPNSGNNIQRLAFAKPGDALAGRWRLFDITTQMLGVPGAFLDYPDLATSANALYMTTNIFLGNGGGSAVVRIPFSGIASGQITAQRFVSPKFGMRVAQNGGTTAFFATHESTSALRVFSWRETAAQPTSRLVPITRWIGGNGYQSRTPDGRRWLDRADSRITGATQTGEHLWFAWSVDRGSNQRPKPFIQIAKIRTSTLTTEENINLFDNNSATAYPALATNSNDEVGISYMIGGGTRFPTHAVGILTGTRRFRLVAASARGPEFSDEGRGEWGDYLAVRRTFPNQKLFAASGFTLKGAGNGTNQDATPRFVTFGRSSDV